MSISIGDALLKLGVDAAGLKTGLADADKQVTGFKGKILEHHKAIGAAMTGIGASITGALVMSIKSAAEEETGIQKLRLALKNVGVDYDNVKDSLEGVISATQTKTSIADDKQREALQALVEITGDYDRALSLLPQTMDMATATGMDLAGAADIVGKVAQGNTGILSRYGIVLKEGATAQDALAAMQSKYAGQAEAYGKTMQGQFDLLKNNFGDLMETIGGVLLPIISDLFKNYISPLITKIKDWAEAHPELTKVIVIVAGAIGGLLTVLGPLMLILPSLITLAPLVGGAFTMMLGPVGLIIAAIAAAVAIGILLYKNWDTIKEKAIEIWGAIKQFFIDLKDKLVEIFLNMTPVGLIIKHWDDIKEGAIRIWEGIKDFLSDILGGIKWAFENLTPVGLIISHWDTISEKAKSIWGDIKRFFEDITNRIRADFEEKFGNIKDTVNSKIKSMAEDVRGYLVGLQQDAEKYGGGIKGYLIAMAEDVGKGVIWFFDKLGIDIEEWGKNLVLWLANLPDKIWDAMKGTWDSFVENVMGVFHKLFGSGAIPEWFDGLETYIYSQREPLQEAAFNAFMGVEEGAKAPLEDFKGKYLPDWAGGVVDFFLYQCSSFLKDASMAAFKGVVEGAEIQFQAVLEKAKSYTQKIIDDFNDSAKQTALKEAAFNYFMGIEAGYNDAAGQIGGGGTGGGTGGGGTDGGTGGGGGGGGDTTGAPSGTTFEQNEGGKTVYYRCEGYDLLMWYNNHWLFVKHDATECGFGKSGGDTCDKGDEPDTYPKWLFANGTDLMLHYLGSDYHLHRDSALLGGKNIFPASGVRSPSGRYYFFDPATGIMYQGALGSRTTVPFMTEEGKATTQVLDPAGAESVTGPVGLQHGGIVRKPLLIGEAGMEAVIPLNKLPDIMKSLPHTRGALPGILNTFNISQLVVREQADIDLIAERLYRLQLRHNRRVGIA